LTSQPKQTLHVLEVNLDDFLFMQFVDECVFGSDLIEVILMIDSSLSINELSATMTYKLDIYIYQSLTQVI